MTSTDFLKQKGLIAPAQSQFIITLASGNQFNLATLLDEYLQGKTNTDGTANNSVSYNLDNLQTVTIPPTDRPLWVGDVLVATSESMYLEIDKEYPIKSFNNGVIVIEAKSGYYLYFSSTEGAVYYYKNYFTLKP